jgi:hypothetical protein
MADCIIFSDFDKFSVIVKTDAKVIWDRRELFICKFYCADANNIHLVFFNAWVEFLNLLIEKSALDLSAVDVNEVHSE